MSAAIIKNAHDFLKIHSEQHKKLQPKEKISGQLNGYKVAVIGFAGLSSVVAAIAAIAALIFASYAIAFVCTAVCVTLGLSAFIASKIDVSNNLYSLIDDIRVQGQKFFDSDQANKKVIEELLTQNIQPAKQEVPLVDEVLPANIDEKKFEKQIKDLKQQLKQAKEEISNLQNTLLENVRLKNKIEELESSLKYFKDKEFKDIFVVEKPQEPAHEQEEKIQFYKNELDKKQNELSRTNQVVIEKNAQILWLTQEMQSLQRIEKDLVKNFNLKENPVTLRLELDHKINSYNELEKLHNEQFEQSMKDEEEIEKLKQENEQLKAKLGMA